MMVKLILHLALCTILFWSFWCRIVKMSHKTTKTGIRLSFVFASVTSLILLIAPFGHQLWAWFPVYRPNVIELLMISSFTAIQLATARYWTRGTPAPFNKDS